MTSLTIAEAMIDAWVNLDWDRVTSLFADEGQLIIVPAGATHTGHGEIRAHLNEVASGIDSLSFDTRYLGVGGANNDIVTFERDDVFSYNGKPARVPVAGIMEISGDQVTRWREYFDGYSMLKAMGKVK